MSIIFDRMSERIEEWRMEDWQLKSKGGNKVLSEVTVAQAYGGMRGVRALICDTSRVPQDKGLIVRGMPLAELVDKTPEEVYFLMLTGDLPTKDELKSFTDDIKARKNVPAYVWDLLRAMPRDTHPMVMLNSAILIMHKESVFADEYDRGIKKDDQWKSTLEDALNLVAKLPAIAAGIYRMKFNKGEIIPPDSSMDLAGDYFHMLGVSDVPDFKDLIRLYLVAHCDHEGGNVSALATQVISSSLADLYYSLSGAFNGLAGPLHGLANQESLKWVLEIMEKYGGTPTNNQIKEIVAKTMESGKVIPGYGHAVLRITDPRFDAFLNFGKKHFPNDPVFLTVSRLYEVVPEELKKIEKIKNPWPNVDAVTGAILYYYGLKEFSYYTVMFAVSRSLGLTAQTVINRAMLTPLFRPKSVSTQYIRDIVG
ncbi:MAG: citrate (Si)-synthase [Ignavibacteriaceae bacterium]|nr:citrate (Si)-synthase [Ignavibacteriaceae bacterium]